MCLPAGVRSFIWPVDSRSANQEIPCFCGTRAFIAVFTKARHCIPSWTIPVHIFRTYFSETCFSTVLLSAIRSPKFSLPVKFSSHSFVWTPPPPNACSLYRPTPLMNLKVKVKSPCLTTRAVWKVRGLTLLLRVGILWGWGEDLFFEVPPLVSDALLTTLHPLLENVLQTVCRKLQEDSGTGAAATRFSFHVRFSVSKALPPFENHSSSHCIISVGLMDEL
jgi:hypothetical protein